jgi:hypothetical protein
MLDHPPVSRDALVAFAVSALLFVWRSVAYAPRGRAILDVLAFGIAVPAIVWIGIVALRRHVRAAQGSKGPHFVRYSGLAWALGTGCAVALAITGQSLSPGLSFMAAAWEFAIRAIATLSIFLWGGLLWSRTVRAGAGIDRDRAD